MVIIEGLRPEMVDVSLQDSLRQAPDGHDALFGTLAHDLKIALVDMRIGKLQTQQLR